MKKIKYIFWIWLLSVLFSTCFGASTTWTLSVFHSVSSSSDYWNSNALFVNFGWYVWLKTNTINYFSLWSWSSTSTATFWGWSFWITIWDTASYKVAYWFPVYRFSFYSPVWVQLTWTKLSWDVSEDFTVFDLSNWNNFLWSLNLNYTHWDFYPSIFNFSSSEYLTFNNETTLAYYWGSHNFWNQWTLKYCFYWVDFDLSCVFYDEILWYHYVNFSLNNNWISISTWFLIIPLNSFYTWSLSNPNRNISSFTWDKTLVIAPWINSQGWTDIIYNIIDIYSSNVSDLKNWNIISRWSFDINIDLFLTRSFLSLPWTVNVMRNWLWYFSEIFELGWNYYYRSNSLITDWNWKSNSTSSSHYNCLYSISACMPIWQFSLVSNSSVPDILNSIWNQSVFTWEISLNPDCVDTQICYELSWTTYCTTRCVSDWELPEGSFIGANWFVYVNDSSFSFNNLLSWNFDYSSWFLDEDWLLSIDYYSWLFNGDSSFRLWVCPYPASNLLSFATKIRIGNFYPFMPLNCFISAFQQWAKVHFFDDFWLFPDLDSQLINWDTNFHITLYRFFDFLLSIWLLFILSALHRLLVK